MEYIGFALAALLAFVVIRIALAIIFGVLDYQAAQKSADTQSRLDEIDVEIGEGFVPDPPLTFPGEADIQRQREEMVRECGDG